jgi:hypothetical protein
VQTDAALPIADVQAISANSKTLDIGHDKSGLLMTLDA